MCSNFIVSFFFWILFSLPNTKISMPSEFFLPYLIPESGIINRHFATLDSWEGNLRITKCNPTWKSFTHEQTNLQCSIMVPSQAMHSHRFFKYAVLVQECHYTASRQEFPGHVLDMCITKISVKWGQYGGGGRGDIKFMTRNDGTKKKHFNGKIKSLSLIWLFPNLQNSFTLISSLNEKTPSTFIIKLESLEKNMVYEGFLVP